MTTATAPAHAAQAPSAYRLTFRGVLAGEWTKFWSLRSTWITAAVSMVLLIVIGLVAASTFDPAVSPGQGGGPGGGGPAGGIGDPVGLALAGTTFASLAFGVLGVLLFAGEYTTGMIRSTLAAVPTRLPVLWAKCLIAGVTAFVLAAVASIVSFLAGSLLLDESARMALTDDGVLRSLLAGALYLALVSILGVALGALLRSSAGGIAVLAGGLLIIPGLMMLLPSSWQDNLTPYLPSSGGSAMMALTTADGALSPQSGLLVLIAWAAALLIASAYRLARTDA
jgi:ABC-2 type transport system permease protein